MKFDFSKIKKTFFLDLPAPKLDQYPIYKISNMIQKIIINNKYDTVFIPSNSDLHVDHKIISHCAVVATRPINDLKINLISYETLSETDWGIYENDKIFIPNFFVTLSQIIIYFYQKTVYHLPKLVGFLYHLTTSVLPLY